MRDLIARLVIATNPGVATARAGTDRAEAETTAVGADRRTGSAVPAARPMGVAARKTVVLPVVMVVTVGTRVDLAATAVLRVVTVGTVGMKALRAEMATVLAATTAVLGATVVLRAGRTTARGAIARETAEAEAVEPTTAVGTAADTAVSPTAGAAAIVSVAATAVRTEAPRAVVTTAPVTTVRAATALETIGTVTTGRGAMPRPTRTAIPSVLGRFAPVTRIRRSPRVSPPSSSTASPSMN
jgi:hypothetical protein